MFDTHAHYHNPKFDADRAEVLGRVFDGGVEAVVNVGTCVVDSQKAVELVANFAQFAMYATVGIHPYVFNSDKLCKSDISKLYQLATKSASVVAVGEIGLDYHSHTSEVISDEQKQWQLEGFEAQIELARQLNLPVIVHCRDAYEDCSRVIVQNPGVKFLMHCYMGGEVVTTQLLERANVMFSFAGNVTYSKSADDTMTRVIAQIPLERIMIETDAPYLAPVPNRGKRCDSTMLSATVNHIAQIKGVTTDKFAQITTDNAKVFFEL